MYTKCYLFKNYIYVSQLIDIIKDYPDYDVYIDGNEGIVVNIDGNYVSFEKYVFDELMFGCENINEYLEFLSNSIIYYHIKIKDLINILKPYKDLPLFITGGYEIVLYLGDNTLNISDTCCMCLDEFIESMQNSGIDYIRID